VDIKGSQVIRPEQSVFKYPVDWKVKIQDINQVLAAKAKVPHPDIVEGGFKMHPMVYPDIQEEDDMEDNELKNNNSIFIKLFIFKEHAGCCQAYAKDKGLND